jgi:NTP pyrophosphatase (non-canonical NTP hydrolase)
VTFDDYQLATARTMNPSLSNDERLLDAAAGIAEEAGEVLAHVRKHLYQDREFARDKLAEELGDVLWCVAAVATAADLNFDTLAGNNLRKLAARHPEWGESSVLRESTGNAQ